MVKVNLDCSELADIYMALVVVVNLGKKDLTKLRDKIAQELETKCMKVIE